MISSKTCRTTKILFPIYQNFMQQITFITGNQAKVEWLQKFLHLPIDNKKISLIEIQSLDLEEVVLYKAKEAYAQTKKPVLVEDTSLVFAAMNKLPGHLIKWFLEELGNDGLCNLLNQYEDRSAIAEVAFCFYDGKNIKIFTAKKHGEIARKPNGNNGFGWDAIFIPEGSDKTWADMDEEEIRETSLRRIADEELEEYLKIAYEKS